MEPNKGEIMHWLSIVIISLFLFGCIQKQHSEIQTCIDGTYYNNCSTDKPFYCDNGTLIYSASMCGCYNYQIIEDNKCRTANQCNNTKHGECSEEKPFFCYDGTLIENATLCGCPTNATLQKSICKPLPCTKIPAAVYLTPEVIDVFRRRFYYEKVGVVPITGEFVFCMYGVLYRNDSCLINEVIEATYLHRSLGGVEIEMCDDHSVGIIHSHPNGVCQFSSDDLQTFNNSSLRIIGVACGQDTVVFSSINGPYTFRDKDGIPLPLPTLYENYEIK